VLVQFGEVHHEKADGYSAGAWGRGNEEGVDGGIREVVTMTISR
tara:strand:- start:2621 stop:2752 length:132 start_codon:yes stop_codon:yes gene_type:complete